MTETIEMAIRCCKNIRNTSVTNHITASMDIAIDALKKQIQEKPNKLIIKGWYRDFEFYCPRCGVYVCSTLDEEYIDFCTECGQAIDWRGIENADNNV